MKFSFNTRLASLVLAFGFFFACAPSKPTIDSLVSTNQYDLALAQIEEDLARDPYQPELQIHKGRINAMMAKEVQVQERGGFYETTVNAFNAADTAGANESQIAKIDSLTNNYWKVEHNAGTAAYEVDTLDNHFAISVAHFSNAIILKPGEVSSYMSKATTQYSAGDVKGAIATLNNAKNTVDEVPPKLYENLGFLYLQNGDPDQSVFYYELANKDITQNKNIAFGLVNAYISASDAEEAIGLLSDLAQNYPNDANIRNVYGTQLYLITEEIMDDLAQSYSEKDTMLVAQIRFEAEGVGEQAEQELVEAYKRDTTNTDYIESLAVFYNNLTGKYLAVIDVAFAEDKEALRAKAKTLLDFAIEYYQKLEEINPNDSSVKGTLNSLNTLKQNRFSS